MSSIPEKRKLFTVAIFLALFLAVSSAHAAEVAVSPSAITVSPGFSVTVSIVVSNISGLYGAAFDVSFNPQILSFVSAQKGTFLEQGGTTSILSTVNPAGNLIVGYSILGTSAGVSGSGTLVTLTFHAISAGTSILNFKNNALCNANSLSGCTIITPTVWNSGTIVVSSGTVTTSPSAPTPTQILTPTPTPPTTPTPTLTPVPTLTVAPTPTPTSTPIPTPTPVLSPVPTSVSSDSTVVKPANPPKGGTFSSFPRPLYRGTKGDDVKTLQTLLIQKGHLPPSNDTGFFGLLTRAAVQKYQCSQNIICGGTESSTGYGVAGPKTIARLSGGAITNSSSTSNLTPAQADAIISILQSFNADASVIASVRRALGR